MGNGRIESIRDVVYVKQDVFDKTKTRDIVKDIEAINQTFRERKQNYILIGPGRWGTRDPFIGIPVNWSQISAARIIVETSLDDFPLDASLGSHFFHNVTSMNVGYFSIQQDSGKDFIDWDKLGSQSPVSETEYLKHVRFQKPLSVVMDGRKRISVIFTGTYRTKKAKTKADE
jgi:hypothetical protein